MPSRKIILIDGVDQVGKTTLCKALSKELKIPVIRMRVDLIPTMDRISSSKIERDSLMFNSTIAQFKDFSFILDRGYTTSLVYSYFFKRKVDLSYIEEVEKTLKPKVFILINSNIKSLATRIDEIIDIKHYEKIQELYIKLAKERNYLIYDTARKKPVDVCREILWKT